MTHVQRLAANLGCLSGNTETLLKCIQTADPVEVVAKDASAAVCHVETFCSLRLDLTRLKLSVIDQFSFIFFESSQVPQTENPVEVIRSLQILVQLFN